MKWVVIFCLLLAVACREKPSAMVHAALVDSHTLKVTGFEYQAIAEMQNDTSLATWQALLPVYKMPADTDMKDYQPAQPGKYAVNGQTVVFTPDTPFTKGQLYFARSYQYNKGIDALSVVKNKGRIGNIPYTDLIFKY